MIISKLKVDTLEKISTFTVLTILMPLNTCSKARTQPNRAVLSEYVQLQYWRTCTCTCFNEMNCYCGLLLFIVHYLFLSLRYYWYNNALQSSNSINSFGGFNFKLLLCFLVSWVAVYLCIFRGIKSSGKVCVQLLLQ